MPDAPLRPCPHPGCPELTRGGRCAEHEKLRNQQIDERRSAPSLRGYDVRWEHLRKHKLAVNPMCQMRTHCAHLSITQQLANQVDHIIPIRQRPDLRLAWNNLQSACQRCHSAKTMRELNEL